MPQADGPRGAPASGSVGEAYDRRFQLQMAELVGGVPVLRRNLPIRLRLFKAPLSSSGTCNSRDIHGAESVEVGQPSPSASPGIRRWTRPMRVRVRRRSGVRGREVLMAAAPGPRTCCLWLNAQNTDRALCKSSIHSGLAPSRAPALRSRGLGDAGLKLSWRSWKAVP